MAPNESRLQYLWPCRDPGLDQENCFDQGNISKQRIEKTLGLVLLVFYHYPGKKPNIVSEEERLP